jgi:hypothetical protein
MNYYIRIYIQIYKHICKYVYTIIQTYVHIHIYVDIRKFTSRVLRLWRMGARALEVRVEASGEGSNEGLGWSEGSDEG